MPFGAVIKAMTPIGFSKNVEKVRPNEDNSIAAPRIAAEPRQAKGRCPLAFLPRFDLRRLLSYHLAPVVQRAFHPVPAVTGTLARFLFCRLRRALEFGPRLPALLAPVPDPFPGLVLRA